MCCMAEHVFSFFNSICYIVVSNFSVVAHHRSFFRSLLHPVNLCIGWRRCKIYLKNKCLIRNDAHSTRLRNQEKEYKYSFQLWFHSYNQICCLSKSGKSVSSSAHNICTFIIIISNPSKMTLCIMHDQWSKHKHRHKRTNCELNVTIFFFLIWVSSLPILTLDRCDLD